MRRLLVDATLIAVVAVLVWFIRGDAQQSEPVAFGQRVQIVCGYGELRGIQVYERVMGVNLTWSKEYPIVPASERGLGQFNDCAIYPMAPAP